MTRDARMRHTPRILGDAMTRRSVEWHRGDHKTWRRKRHGGNRRFS